MPENLVVSEETVEIAASESFDVVEETSAYEVMLMQGGAY